MMHGISRVDILQKGWKNIYLMSSKTYVDYRLSLPSDEIPYLTTHHLMLRKKWCKVDSLKSFYYINKKSKTIWYDIKLIVE